MQGSGVQAVAVENGSYQLKKQVLSNILLRDEVKDLPVAVVSVAGACRGGKSFLLNFFLRYITAPRSSQLDGSWLGKEDAPLEGFSWRGGTVRDTTGIVIWSEPIITTLHTGETVAVILMDTQGTFDSSSTVRDCSTIFALSTLLSSVQIYNLSQMIREDNLQHLQLFTEYGNLIKDTNSKAFQVLEFLVRDWANVVDYPYGCVGGNLYLDNILQIQPCMDKELRKLREHIRSSFEQVSCFLMPHPGLEVIEPGFRGENNDISPKFQKSVKELASHIFGPDRLKTKEIGGQKLTAGGLYTYFEAYVNLFNSDDIPTPTNIMQATAEAGLLSAYEESRRLYESGMESECGSSQPSLPAYDLKDVHQTCANKAIAAFTNKKKMGDPNDAKNYLDRLKAEMESRLVQFVDLNVGKIQKTINEGKELYETKTGQIEGPYKLCVHPFDLEELHLSALRAAIDLFDSKRRTIANKEDKDRADFVKIFERQYGLLKQYNDRNNEMNVMELRLEYCQTMENTCSGGTLSENDLQKAHQEALANAVDSFASRRNQPDNHDTDDFKSDLIEKIQNCFNQMRQINMSQNQAALQSGIRAYDNHMASAWNPKKVCLHPGDLEMEQEAGERKAMTEFRPTKVGLGKVYFDITDSDEKILAEVIQGRFNEIKKSNDSTNAAAVTAAADLYSADMYHNCGFSGWWVVGIGIPYLVNKSRRNRYHNEAKEKALNQFFGSRRATKNTAKDKFLDDLQEEKLLKDHYSQARAFPTLRPATMLRNDPKKMTQEDTGFSA